MIDGRRRGLATALALLLAVALAPLQASAGGPDNVKKSREFFEEADSLANQGRWKDACVLFQGAHDLNATNGTAYRTADCYERTGEDARAVQMYQYVLDHRATDKVPERVVLAERHLQDLQQKMARAQAGAGAGQRRVVDVPPPPPKLKPNRVPAIVAFSVGGVGIVVGSIFGGLALAQIGHVRSVCSPNPCSPTQPNYSDLQNQFDAAVTKSHVSTATLIVGVVGVAVGVGLWVAKQPKAAEAVKRAMGPEGLTLHF